MRADDLGRAWARQAQLDAERGEVVRHIFPDGEHYQRVITPVEGRRVILVDDVLYTGRSIQAALSALTHYGRPREVSLVTLIDRRFNRHLPIQANYVGLRVDALDEAYVKVEWNPDGSPHQVLLFAQKSEKED